MKPDFKIILAMAIFGSIGLFVKSINLPSIEMVFLRAIIASVFLFIVKTIAKKRQVGEEHKEEEEENKKDNKKNMILLIISGFVMVFNWLLLFQAYKYTTIANGTLSYYAAPIFVVLISPIVLKEKLTVKKLASVIVAMFGLALIVMNQPQGGSGNYIHSKGIAYGILAAIAYAAVVLLNKCIKNFSSYDRTFVQIFISTIILTPIVIYRGNLYIENMNSLINILILGVVHTGVAYLLYFSGIEHVTAQRASLLSYIDPISALVYGTIFLGEPLGIYHIVGGLMIILSTLDI
ncbi:DMT family transporter [Clostridium sp. MSJ-11]|uniref:DMT family transporter n=1 Tax=Clostridium mobile TaxID=2841512 RepID=A0ABS6EI43_9CLOT|nr:DMT family transporter [Clostridium mobile]MBU5484708.1 DMT family transporter [Clostridium mobile]